MKYWFDTEFIEDGSTIDLISIAIVAEDGREFYAEVDQRDVDHEKADEWVKTNVIAHLWHRQKDKREFNAWIRDGGKGGLLQRHEIAREILWFIGPVNGGTLIEKPEFWAYYADYDWVVLCQLFGRMIDLPEGWPMMAYDLRQWLDFNGYRDIRQPDMPHHALSDAKWIASTYMEISDAIAKKA